MRGVQLLDRDALSVVRQGELRRRGQAGNSGASAGSSSVMPTSLIPSTRYVFSWSPPGPPNENAPAPCSEKTSRTSPANGALSEISAEVIWTSTVASGRRVNVTLPETRKIPPMSIVRPSVVGFPSASTPTANCLHEHRRRERDEDVRRRRLAGQRRQHDVLVDHLTGVVDLDLQAARDRDLRDADERRDPERVEGEGAVCELDDADLRARDDDADRVGVERAVREPVRAGAEEDLDVRRAVQRRASRAGRSRRCCREVAVDDEVRVVRRAEPEADVAERDAERVGRVVDLQRRPLGSTIVSLIAPPVRLISSTGVASPIGIVTVPRKTPATPLLVSTNPPRPFEKSTGPLSESTEPTCRFSTAILTMFSAGFDVRALRSKTKLPETSSCRCAP